MRREATKKVNLEEITKHIDPANVRVWEVEDNDGLWELSILYSAGDKVTKHHYDTKRRTLHLSFKFFDGLSIEAGYKLLIPAGTKKIKVDKVERYGCIDDKVKIKPY